MSDRDKAEEIAELRRAIESIEALGERLAELIVAQQPVPQVEPLPARLLSAAEVSKWWGLSRRWVYNHADQLGARRLGAGARPRLRFDPEEVTERLGAPLPQPGQPDGRRLTAIGRTSHSNSLSQRSRAKFDGQQEHVAGRRSKALGPASKDKVSTR